MHLKFVVLQNFVSKTRLTKYLKLVIRYIPRRVKLKTNFRYRTSFGYKTNFRYVLF
nr:MAG TPA: Galactose-binding domain-like [Caudoviricetes sp.]